MAETNKLPKKMIDGIVKLDDKEIKLNFGLQFACDVDNYREDVAMMQGIDNIVIVATSLIKRKLDVLKDLLTFSLKGIVEDEVSTSEKVLEQYAMEKGGLEKLYNLFFTNVLANPFLSEQVQMNLKIINHIMNMAKIEQQAKEMQLEEMIEAMNKEMEQAKEMMKNKKA